MHLTLLCSVLASLTAPPSFFLFLHPLPPPLSLCSSLPLTLLTMLYKNISGEPAPPPSVTVDADGLSLVATWSEPFSLKGEQLSYVVSITNTATRAQEEFNVSTTRFVLSEPIGERDCAEYQFTVFSRNSYSSSQIGVTERIHIPTSNWCEVCAYYVHASVCILCTCQCVHEQQSTVDCA